MSIEAEQSDLEQALIEPKFPVFVTRYGPAAWPVTDAAAGPPVIVLSVPKSGTYFTEALYKRMGYQGIYVHAMNTYCSDWRFGDEQCHGLFKLAGDKPIPITILSRLVLPGQIIVSHCGCNPAIEAALCGFRKIYLYRDLREVLISITREEAGFDVPPGELAARVAALCRRRGQDVKEVAQAVSAWRNRADVLTIDFAELTSADPARQERLAARFEAFMGWPKVQVMAALRAVPGDETPTRSPHRSTLADGWDDQCDAWFKEHMADVRVVPNGVL